MIKQFDNIKISVLRPQSDLLKLAERKLGAHIKYFRILKKSLDARDKNNIFWVYSVACSDEEVKEKPTVFEKIRKKPKVLVVGGGPAGLMCSLRLIDRGFEPLIIERGQPVEDRRTTCEKFFSQHILDPESNVQFGEGGAGAFSDGKLNTQTRDGFNRDVLNYFVKFGAPEEILYLNKPHVGSDNLYNILQNMRAYIIANGGNFLFNTRVDSLEICAGNLIGVFAVNTRSKEEYRIGCDAAVFAVGHSARDTFKMLNDAGVQMEARDFAVGVRIEHLAEQINFSQYGKTFKQLPAADYKLVSHAHERTVFTFCMCPGGVVIPAASEVGGVVVNGMSLYARNGVNSNCALMVQMKKSDFGGDDLFAGVRFQQTIEHNAYVVGGGGYRAPAITFGDFALDKFSGSFDEVQPTYSAGVTYAPLNNVLPKVAVEALKTAIPDMDKKLKGFASPHAILTGVETRFSSPVRLLRDSSMQSVSLKNLYLCGEGSGYSGGITSSAADGIRVAEVLFERFK